MRNKVLRKNPLAQPPLRLVSTLSTYTCPKDAFGHGADNHLNPKSNYSKYLEAWTLNGLVYVDTLLREDDPQNDRRVAKILVDFIKRLEINSDRLLDLQQRVEIFHNRLRNLQSNQKDSTTRTAQEGKSLQVLVHMLEDERKTLRNLQKLHLDTWKKAKDQYMAWSPDGDENIDNDDDCKDPIMVLNPKRRRARWNALVSVASEIQARHAMTIEQMSELVIRLKALGNDRIPQFIEARESFDEDSKDLYHTVCAFMRCRMTQQLLCQHLMALGKDALGTSIAKKIEAKRKIDLAAGLVTSSDSSNGRVIGAINLDSPVAPIVRSSVTEASQLCEATFLVSPPVAFVLAKENCTHDNQGDEKHQHHNDNTVNNHAIYEDVSATFVRSWLQYTLIELLKNAMAATVESNPEITKAALDSDSDSDSDNDSDSDSEDEVPEGLQPQLPTLYINIFEDDSGENVVIEIYDQGGGIGERFDLESLFRFAQRDTVWDRMDEQQTYSQVRSPLKGLGVGLSLSRWHMRHFGGDLTLERRPAGAIRVIDDSYHSSKWHVLEKGMTVTIKIPKDVDIPLVIS